MPEIRASRYARTLTRSEAARIASHERLAQSADWSQFTAKANKSKRHVSRMERWRDIAKTQYPHLEGAELERVAEDKRREFYQELGRSSWANRRPAA